MESGDQSIEGYSMALAFTAIRSYWLVITSVSLIGITILSLFPLTHLPAAPGSDKTHHLIAYAALMFPVALRKPSYWLLIGVFFAGWSGAIELIQPYVNRFGEWLDLLANIAGLITGGLLAYLVNRVSQYASYDT